MTCSTLRPLANGNFLADLVPLHDVATYRSYVNIAQTVGRSSGGAIGGYISQLWGWRGYAFALRYKNLPLIRHQELINCF